MPYGFEKAFHRYLAIGCLVHVRIPFLIAIGIFRSENSLWTLIAIGIFWYENSLLEGLVEEETWGLIGEEMGIEIPGMLGEPSPGDSDWFCPRIQADL